MIQPGPPDDFHRGRATFRPKGLNPLDYGQEVGIGGRKYYGVAVAGDCAEHGIDGQLHIDPFLFGIAERAANQIAEGSRPDAQFWPRLGLPGGEMTGVRCVSARIFAWIGLAAIDRYPHDRPPGGTFFREQLR